MYLSNKIVNNMQTKCDHKLNDTTLTVCHRFVTNHNIITETMSNTAIKFCNITNIIQQNHTTHRFYSIFAKTNHLRVIPILSN